MRGLVGEPLPTQWRSKSPDTPSSIHPLNPQPTSPAPTYALCATDQPRRARHAADSAAMSLHAVSQKATRKLISIHHSPERIAFQGFLELPRAMLAQTE